MIRLTVSTLALAASLLCAAGPVAADPSNRGGITQINPEDRAYPITRQLQAYGHARGAGNVARLLRSGRNNDGGITQSGRGNRATITQTGDNNTARVTQRGNNKRATVIQRGNDTDVYIDQHGDGPGGALVITW